MSQVSSEDHASGIDEGSNGSVRFDLQKHGITVGEVYRNLVRRNCIECH